MLKMLSNIENDKNSSKVKDILICDINMAIKLINMY